MAASSRSAISRLVDSSRRERAASPSSAAASRVRSTPSAWSWLASPSSLRSASRRRSTAASSESSASARRFTAGSIALWSVIAFIRAQKLLRGQRFRRRTLRAARSRVNAWRAIYPDVFASLCMAARRPRRHIDSEASHAIHPRKQAFSMSANASPTAAVAPTARREQAAASSAVAHADHGQCHPRVGDGRRRAGEIRPSRPAHGRRRRGDRPVHAIPEIRSGRSGLARPRPLRALGRPRLDADLRAALSHRLSGDDARADQALPPARLDHRRPSGIRPHARRRDHHRPARARPRQRGRHGDRRAASRGGIRRRRGRSQDLRARLRRRPDGRHQPGSHRARRSSQAQPADRAVRRQRHFHRRRAVARRQRRPGEALRGRRLGRFARRRARSGGHRRRAGEGASLRPAGDDRLQDHHRLWRAEQGRQVLGARLAARRRRDQRRAREARLVACAVRNPGRHSRRLAQGRRALEGRACRLEQAPRRARCAQSAPSSSAA